MKPRHAYWRSGDPFVWLTGGGLAVCLLMVAGLVLLILVQGLGCFWPAEVSRLTLRDGAIVLGEIADREPIPHPGEPADTTERFRIKVKQGNRDVLGNDFVWIDETTIEKQELPAGVVVVERREWGNLYGFLRAVKDGDRMTAPEPATAWAELLGRLPAIEAVAARVRAIERDAIGAISREQERIRLALRRLELAGTVSGERVERLEAERAEWQRRHEEEVARLAEARAGLTGAAIFDLAGGTSLEVPLAQIVRVHRPNDLGTAGRLGVYFDRIWEFVSGDPRESNTEGGIFPAIFGTVMMVMLMSIAVTPMGVLAALFLREFARQGRLVSLVRIAVNNLAGVPSIVFGVFGVGFFVYFVGGTLDRVFHPEALPAPTYGTGGILWASLTLSLLTVPVVIVATEEGLAAVPRGLREASLALGATRFETVWRVVLPCVMPSILTGMILAIARAAGEVAPLMITGVVKLAPTLPLDGQWPFLHLDRKFMHLGFHIYDVGFQSPNVDAAQPMVYATALLLLLIVILLNLAAIVLRKRLRARLQQSVL